MYRILFGKLDYLHCSYVNFDEDNTDEYAEMHFKILLLVEQTRNSIIKSFSNIIETVELF